MASSLAATASTLNVPKTISGISDVATAFNLGAHWTAASPSSASDLDALALPTNVIDRTAGWLMQNWNVSSSSLTNAGFVNDPFGNQSDDLVLSVSYPAGTRDGSQFFMTPMRSGSNVQSAALQYDVAFDAGFDFVKGGKLPGLYGSQRGAESVCSGGNHQSSCFSARLMWRTKGAGEVYAYIPSYPGFVANPVDVDCNDIYGISLSRGSFDFAAGGWTTITQVIALNTPGYANGQLFLWANNSLALAHTGIVFRTSESVTLSKIMFSTFFGGSEDSWNSKGGRSYFRNFEVFASQTPSNTSGPAVNATLSTSSSAQTVSPSSLSLIWISLLALFLSSFVVS
ncbi:hypothetical protein JCM11491_004239 [Sporobolomyces phaffii]